MSPFTRDILTKILIKDPKKRLGANGIDEIMNHPFFETIDWDALENKDVKPPYRPRVKSDHCVKYIADNWLEEPVQSSPESSFLGREEMELKYVQNFSYVGNGESFMEMTKCETAEKPLESKNHVIDSFLDIFED
jgi:serine/threonine protein kinase